jgi:glutathione peroxidase-family protein
MAKEFYELSMNTPQGQPVSMSRYEGKVILVVNTATNAALLRSSRDWSICISSIRIRGWSFLASPAINSAVRNL